MARASQALVVAALSLAAAGCMARLPSGERHIVSGTTVTLHDHILDVHLSHARQGARAPLLLYATGDAGWWGSDKEIFEQLAGWDYPVAGFSARDYVRHFRAKRATLEPAEVADDFEAIAEASRAALQLPASTPIVLVGKSRGAGLIVAAAMSPALRPSLAGILAVGLTREEEYVELSGPGHQMLLTYPALAQINQIPIAVVQSTHDDYVPADVARRLFGLDTPMRELRPIASGDHNFSDARDALYREMNQCFAWIISHR